MNFNKQTILKNKEKSKKNVKHYKLKNTQIILQKICQILEYKIK